MKTNEQGLTREEKIMFFILFIILMLTMGVFIIKTFSQHERVLTNETPVSETEKNNGAENSNNQTDASLIEEKTESKKVAYVKNTYKKKSATLLKDTKKEEETVIQPVIIHWDFPSKIVTSAKAGETISIDRNVVLASGKTDLAQVTVRKLINDVYMIQDVSEDVLTLTEGTYKYYYTYANITKELELIVTGNLNPTSVYKPSIIDTLENDEDLKKLQEYLENVSVSYEENKIDLTLKENAVLYEIPLYLTLDKDLTEASVSSKTYGIRVSNINIDTLENLKENELVLWINLEIISAMEQSEISIFIDGVTYTVTLHLNFAQDKIDSEEKEDTKNEEKDETDKEEDKENLEDDLEKPDKGGNLEQQNTDSLEKENKANDERSSNLKEFGGTNYGMLEELP